MNKTIDLNNFTWQADRAAFALVGKLHATNVDIKRENIKLPAAFGKALDLTFTNADGLKEYVEEQQKANQDSS